MAAVTPRKKRPPPATAVTPSKKEATPWTMAMSVFAKFKPGLGHDGRGLYGTLTDASMLRMLGGLGPLTGTTHVDIGAADGKVMLGALALGADRSLGIELAGPALGEKFSAMRAKLSTSLDRDLNATLLCETDVADLGPSLDDWLRDAFDAFDTDGDVKVTAVWHGFTVESKECVLEALARSSTVSTFCLVGPKRKDYGKADDVFAFFSRIGVPLALVGDDKATLAGGEQYRILTFRIPRPGASSSGF